MLPIGDAQLEVAAGTVAVRMRGEGNKQEIVTVEDFIVRLTVDVKERALELSWPRACGCPVRALQLYDPASCRRTTSELIRQTEASSMR